MTNNQKAMRILEELVEVCRDGQEGYRDAAEHVADRELSHFFNQQSLDRAGFAGELEQELINLGSHDPNRSGSAKAAIHRAWIDLKSTLGGGDHTLLSSVEAGEDSAMKAFEQASRNPDLPEGIAVVIRRQFVSIQAAHDHIRSLRDIRAA